MGGKYGGISHKEGNTTRVRGRVYHISKEEDNNDNKPSEDSNLTSFKRKTVVSNRSSV